jgi:hypothetical protein
VFRSSYRRHAHDPDGGGPMSAAGLPVAIAGGGIAGLAMALNLHARSIPCRVYEAASELKPLGVGITLLPHAMRELKALCLPIHHLFLESS